MAKTEALKASIGWRMRNFRLMNVDEVRCDIFDLVGEYGTVVMFICNHCPYVKEIISDLVGICEKLQKVGIDLVAIMSNDVVSYPEDSFEKMKEFAKLHNFNFPYLIDETQEVAKAYGAVCTPDFFGFNNKLELQYRGCFINKQTGNHDLLDAMTEIAQKGSTGIVQVPSIGCSIKWKADSGK